MDAVELIGGDEELIRGFVFDVEIFFFDAFLCSFDEALEHPDSEIDVDDVVTGFEIEDSGDWHPLAEFSLGEFESGDAVEFVIGDDGKFGFWDNESGGGVSVNDIEPGGKELGGLILVFGNPTPAVTSRC